MRILLISGLALGFLLFYSDEIRTRYAWPGGTGGGTEILVREVKNTPDGNVEATFERDGRLHVMKARQAIVAAPLKVAAKTLSFTDFIDGRRVGNIHSPTTTSAPRRSRSPSSAASTRATRFSRSFPGESRRRTVAEAPKSGTFLAPNPYTS